ncbi:MAG: hypothetical protein M1830_003298 [Pleopsidium flavum]|nr:MAG: hypothetical protein M1830_003298 [Pleopsidium flavum]
MAQGGYELWYGRPDTEYLKANTLADLKILCNKYGLEQSSLLQLNKRGWFAELKRHIATRNPRPIATEIWKDFSLPNFAAPTGATQGQPGKTTQGQPGKTTQGQPGKTTQGQPGTNTQGQPGKITQGQPGKTTQGQPGKTTQGQPVIITQGSGSDTSNQLDPDVPVKTIDKPRSRLEPNIELIQEALRSVLDRLIEEGVSQYDRGLRHDLEAIASAYTMPTDQGITASSIGAFRTARLSAPPRGTGSEVSFVRMSLQGLPAKYEFAADGMTFPYRGRGPIWEANSCALDCCVVAGIFLDAGSTEADKGSGKRADWAASLTSVQVAFVKAVKLDWTSMTGVTGKTSRDELFNAFLLSHNKNIRKATPNAPLLARGRFIPTVSVWDLCTMNFHQFTFLTRYRFVCKSCGFHREDQTITPQSFASIELNPNEEKQPKKPSFEHLLRRFFDETPGKDCKTCGNKGCRVRRRIVIGDLPPRLVVQPNPAMRYMQNSTSDKVSLEFEDADGHTQTAVYAWIGGIYLYKNHYRTYWNDGKIGDKQRLLRLYDGMVIDGIILGGVKPANARKRRVPQEWDDGADLLFYERVDNPAVETVLNIVREAADIVQERQEKVGGDTQKESKKRKIEKT